MGKNYGLELYKLLMNTEEDDIDISYVEEFGWVNNTEYGVDLKEVFPRSKYTH